MKLLTIVVPTYNRANSLQLLLRFLQLELKSLQDSVQVLVSDNASTDRTPQVLQVLQANWPELVTRRNAQNLGADGNFCECVDRIDSRYFWIVGDDDLPKTGVIGKLTSLLRKESPELVYMQSEWVTPITGPDQGDPVGELHFQTMERFEFAQRVHVWFTFISGIVVNRESLMQSLNGHTIRRHTGTSLVQLGWVFPVLRLGSKFLFISDRCVLATKNNTGGYALLTVFGVNFSRIVRDTFGYQSHLANALIARNITHYLPGIIWGLRASSTHRFIEENPWPAMHRELRAKFMFWALLVPLGRFPKLFAVPVYQAWRIFNRLGREWERCSAHLRHAGTSGR